MLYVREYYLMAITQAVMVIQGVIYQQRLDETRISDHSTLSPSLFEIWNDIKRMNLSSYVNHLVGTGELLSRVLYEKGIVTAIEMIIETYLRKWGMQYERS